MTNQEIKEKIDQNNAKIESLLNPATFVLNTEIQNLVKENKELAKQCTHEFKNGICIYCYTPQ